MGQMRPGVKLKATSKTFLQLLSQGLGGQEINNVSADQGCFEQGSWKKRQSCSKDQRGWAAKPLKPTLALCFRAQVQGSLD